MGNGRVLSGFVAAAVAVATLGFTSGTASATAVGSLTDPAGDNGTGLDPRGDIVAYAGGSNGAQVVLTVTSRQFDDPQTSTNWINGYAFIYFDLYVEGGYDDYARIVMYNDYTTVVADPEFPCSGVVPSWNAAASSYTVTVPTTCFGNFSSIQAYASFDYETSSTFSSDDTELLLVHNTAPAGYWMATAAGRVYSFGGVSFYGDAVPSFGSSIVDIEPSPAGRGYNTLDDRGRVSEFGDAEWWGDATVGYTNGERATAISGTPSGDGYWIFTNLGRAIAFGDAEFFGDMSHVRLNGPVLDSIATPSGRGYYMVASDGGVFAFGDAQFFGSMGGVRLNAPVMSLVPDPDGVGYWLVASDGGVFAFQAGFRGSMGATRLNRPVTGMVPFGDGYLMVGEDGGIFSFSSLPFFGSLGANPPPSPVVSVAAAV